MKLVDIRKQFLDYFESKGHKIVASAPLVIKNDPTLMFTNAGMNQFKDYFLGNTVPDNRRIADTQKCLRVSGKHNDLEEVGHDTYHHTMFEMLGNWSFGDYFKEEAIAWAWDLLTNVYKIDKSRLYVTVFEGDDADGVPRDDESINIWKKFIDEDRIILANKKDNFWEMGDTGPCGPCTEIHVDARLDSERAKSDGKVLVNQDHPQVIEIWNNVFIQFNRLASGKLEPLPEKHVDTGMGLERLAMVLQGKQSNYDIDFFQNMIRTIETLSGFKYAEKEETDIAMRVIADHIRAIAFSIADGQVPANNGAGYVIRRILRRAVRYGYTYLNMREPFLCELSRTLEKEMGGAFPELVSNAQLIEKVIREEESSFFRTLESGIKRMDLILNNLKASNQNIIPGAEVFELYDTYGFPVDLTSLIARENGVSVDEQGFETALEEQKNRSRSAAAISADDWQTVHANDTVEFVGYDNTSADSRITKYRRITQKDKTLYQLVLDKTPFYAESGGQVGDSGVLIGSNEKVNIIDTKKENNLIIHLTTQLPENLSQTFRASINIEKRASTTNNHSATHLLHQALREILGTHVEQKGSLVHPDYLRFDFSHFSKITDEELAQVENRVNALIKENLALQEYRNIPIDEAKAMGAMALFGEKYGDEVRAIKFGESIELCGGTHVSNTGNIGVFKITTETAVAAGIRRIEAISGEKAMEMFKTKAAEFDSISAMFNKPKNLTATIEDLVAKNQELQKTIEKLNKEKAQGLKNELKNKFVQKDGYLLLAEKAHLDAGGIKDILFQFKGDLSQPFVAIIGGIDGDKASLNIMISESLVAEKSWNAGILVKEHAKHINGGGGGQNFFATAGGKNPGGLDAAIEAVLNSLT
jgi:alanyl-tRNA synthetase